MQTMAKVALVVAPLAASCGSESVEDSGASVPSSVSTEVEVVSPRDFIREALETENPLDDPRFVEMLETAMGYELSEEEMQALVGALREKINAQEEDIAFRGRMIPGVPTSVELYGSPGGNYGTCMVMPEPDSDTVMFEFKDSSPDIASPSGVHIRTEAMLFQISDGRFLGGYRNQNLSDPNELNTFLARLERHGSVRALAVVNRDGVVEDPARIEQVLSMIRTEK